MMRYKYLGYEIVERNRNGDLVIVAKSKVNGRKIAATFQVTMELYYDDPMFKVFVAQTAKTEAFRLYKRDWWKFPFWDIRDYFLRLTSG